MYIGKHSRFRKMHPHLAETLDYIEENKELLECKVEEFLYATAIAAVIWAVCALVAYVERLP